MDRASKSRGDSLVGSRSTSSHILDKPVVESITRASCMDGTASLANRDFGRVLRANQQKVVFSGAAKSANDAAIARYFGVLKGVSPEIRTPWRSGMDSNPHIWTQPRSQAARSTKVKPVAFVYTASVRSSVICSGP